MTIRVLQAGKVPSIHFTVNCPRCNCVFECDPSETFFIMSTRQVECPTCKYLCVPIDKSKSPKWTVFYNIVSPENGQWIGTGWEFFDEESHANNCLARHLQRGNVPSKRPFHPNDHQHLGAAHR